MDLQLQVAGQPDRAGKLSFLLLYAGQEETD